MEVNLQMILFRMAPGINVARQQWRSIMAVFGPKMRNQLTLSLVTTLALFGCQGGGKRGSKIGAQPITLQVELLNMDDKDGAESWVYELSECVPTVTGELDKANPKYVRFKSTDFQPGQVCQMRVKSAQDRQDIAFFDGEESVLYWAREVIIGTGPEGNYAAYAELSRRFNRVAPDGFGSFSLRVDVEFPAEETESPIAATIKCIPDILNAGEYKASDATHGWFSFKVPIQRKTSFQCSQIHVAVNGRGMKYLGEFADGAGLFDGEADAQINIATPVKLQYQEPPTPPGDVDVDVGEVKGCDEGQVYDRAENKCVES